jgi:hypothetical protein
MTVSASQNSSQKKKEKQKITKQNMYLLENRPGINWDIFKQNNSASNPQVSKNP